MDYNARYYSPVLGRFVSPDTIVPEVENPQHWNRYSYVYNNPVLYRDPTGHQGCENEPEYDRLTWPDVVDAVKNSVGEDIALELVRRGVPTTIGYKYSVTGSWDIIFGGDFSADITPAYNWYSGEAGVIISGSYGLSIGLPQGLGANASGGPMLGQGATELDSFAGSSTTIYGSIAADKFGKVGLAGSYGWGVNESGEMYLDPKSGTGVVAMNLGASVGVNGIANGVDVRGGISKHPKGINNSRVINSAEDFMEFVDDVKEVLPSGTCALGQCFKWK